MRGERNTNFWTACRDFLISALPLAELPSFLVRLFYGVEPTFVFLTHPRGPEDIYRSFPVFRRLARIFSEQFVLWLISFSPAYVVARVNTKEGIHGMFVSTSLLPTELFSQRNRMLNHAERLLRFIRKITSKRVYIGLAAWWPMVTNNGLALRRFLQEGDRLVVTNGHTATLASIALSVERLCDLAGLPLNELKLLVVGVGKMGGAVAEAFNGKVALLGLVDQNPIRLERFECWLKEKSRSSETERIVVREVDFSEKVVLSLGRYHIAVCTTSNIGYVIQDASVLRDCIILDDARPEAFPRVVDAERNVAVLEGGLMRVQGVEVDGDFGFGAGENVFGCLAEALLLNFDGLRTLKPTLGEVDAENYNRLLEFCRNRGITQGEFKSGHETVGDELLRKILKAKMSELRRPHQVL